MKIGAIFAALLLLFAAIYIPESADAARMGGGRSFGGKPSMSRPAAPPAMRQQTPGTTQPGAAASKPGMFGGAMGGLFGGLLAGTLLGSLLSGNGLGGGGFMDLLILALLVFVGYKLFMRFRQRQAQQQQPAAAGGYGGGFGGGGGFGQSPQPMSRNDSASSGWDALRNSFPGAAPASARPDAGVPAGFDVEEFLRGAKMAYNRMQSSWDQRDINDIAQFATPAVINALKEQLASDPGPSHTELVLVNASLIGVEDDADGQRAQVYFDVLMREHPDQTTPTAVREIWHFLRQGGDGVWKLDGIQQVA